MLAEIGLKNFTAYGLINVFKSSFFIAGLLISGSAALFSSATNFLSVVVVISAYFLLHERMHIIEKTIAVTIGIAGLIMITT